MTGPLLEARGLTKTYGALRANEDIDIALTEGRIHAVIGPNGAGKTTLIGLLAGDIRPDRGKVHLGGADVSGHGPERRARAGLARSYQVSSLFDSFSAAENVEIAITGRGGRLAAFADARTDTSLREEARAHLAAVGAGATAESPVTALAHGERRLVELAMVLALAPAVVLLDEPMAGLGSAETAALLPVIAGLKAGRGVLLVEHDMSVVFELADRITVLVAGRVIASGPPEDIRADADVRAAYLSGEA